MTILRATGLVLRTRPLTDTSLVVHWLTREFGRVATVARGARRSKSPFRGQIDLFYLAEISVARSSRSDLHTLRELRLMETHASWRANLDCLRQASYAVKLIEQTTETETPVPAIFDLFLGLLRYLPTQPPRLKTVFAFEMKLLRELGLEPPLAAVSLTPGAREVLHQLLIRPWDDLPRLHLSAGQETEIRAYLQGFMIYHLEKMPRRPPRPEDADR